MAYAKKEDKKDIKCDVLVVLKNATNQKGDGGYWIRIVSWVIDGKGYKPSLEKRDYFVGERGEQMGKAKGFSSEDVLFLLANLGTIATHMKIDGRFIQEALSAVETVPEPTEPVATDGRETF